MIHFKLDSNWKILSVIRCSNSHATLSVQHIYSGEIKVLSIYAKEHFQHKLYFDISHIKHRHLLPISQIQLKHGWRLVYFPMLTPLKDYIHSNALSLSDILSLAHQLHWKFSTSIIYYTWMCLRIISLWIMMVLLY